MIARVMFLGLLLATHIGFAQQPRNILTSNRSLQDVQRILLPADQWHPFPKAHERPAWMAITPEVRNAYVQRAESLLHCDWTTPKATVFLEYVRNGNRTNYQSISFGRREQLATLVLAECMEGKGRFLDDIVNGIWTICEETYWGVPAHISAQKRGAGLPDITEPTVDLFAAETATLLAWTSYLLRDSLDRISPLIGERIDYEVNRRILHPNLERDDFGWMGFTRRVNNWNPWICSNWLTATLLLEKDQERRARSVHKILRCLDNFLNPYPADGGCDEGPTYWGRAGASLFDCLELLKSATNGTLNVYAQPLIQSIGTYIAKVYIHDQYFVNFADAAAKHHASASSIFRFGKAIKDSTMIRFGAFLGKQQRVGRGMLHGQFGVLGRVLPALFALPEMLRAKGGEPLVRDFWFPDLQVMGGRSSEGTIDGLYLAAKGGHNAESHNHNDVGNFIVYADGEPVIIDVGVETYTARTFSKDRYSIWTMQSAYHNLPTINGVMQKDGREFQATDVRYNPSETSPSFELNIARAYPSEAAVRNWTRTITLHRGKRVTIREEYELQEKKKEFQWTLMTCLRPEVGSGGTVRLISPKEGEGKRAFVVTFDATKFVPAIEPIDIPDPQLQSSWGDKIYRVLLTSRDAPIKDAFSVQVEKVQ